MRPKFTLVRQRLQETPIQTADDKSPVSSKDLLTKQYQEWKSAHLRSDSPNQAQLLPLDELGWQIALNESSVVLPRHARSPGNMLQHQYTGTQSAISSAVADVPCRLLAMDALLMFLNILLKTHYTPEETPHLANLLQSYTAYDSQMDFGMAYARLRPHWASKDFKDFDLTTEVLEREFEECRQSLVVENVIVSSRVPPRRLWDLHSNRVIQASLTAPRNDPHRLCRPGEESLCRVAGWYAVSHSWVDESERNWIWTGANGRQWRIPLPRDTTLECIRIELLNLISKEAYHEPSKASGYAWLDLLCLRQEDGMAVGDHLRVQEHAIDVPTIGSVYQQCHSIIQYFCGLGRPFLAGDEESERYWLNRAWTLQEAGSQRTSITAGVTTRSPPDPWRQCTCDSSPPTPRRFSFDTKQRCLLPHLLELPRFQLILEMSCRQSVHPVDKIAGLLYPLKSEWLFTYHSGDNPDEAWTMLLNVVSPETVACIAASFPGQGQGLTFLPTWNQIQLLDQSDFKDILLPALKPSRTQWSLFVDETVSDFSQSQPFFAIPTYPSTPLVMLGGHFRGTFPTLRDVAFVDPGSSDTTSGLLGSTSEEPTYLDSGEDHRQKPMWATIRASQGEERVCVIPRGSLRAGSVYDLVMFESRGWAQSEEKFVALIGYIWSGSFTKVASATIFRRPFNDVGEHLMGVPLKMESMVFK